MNKLISLITILLLIISCEKETEEIDLLDWEYGKNEYNMEMDGEIRNFLIHIPASYEEDQNVPVVFMLHGSTGTGTKFYNISGWVEKAEEKGFIAVFPTALEYSLKEGGRSTKWSSAGLVNDVLEGTEIKDDIPFITSLIELVKTNFSVNGKKIYISGFSNGGGFVKSQVVPRMGDQFAAANATGGVGIPEVFSIETNRIMPFHNISGTMDDRIWEAIGLPEELPIKGEDIEDHDFLWNALETMCETLELESTYNEEQHIPDYNMLSFKSKKSSNASEFIFVMVKGLEHKYPNGNNNPRGYTATDILWEWYDQHEL